MFIQRISIFLFLNIIIFKIRSQKLLKIPFKTIYNTTDIKQLFSVYFNFAKNLRDIFGLTWFPSFKSKDKEFANEVQTFGTLILLEFVKNAIVHGNLADLSKPIYIKYGKINMANTDLPYIMFIIKKQRKVKQLKRN